MNRINRQFDDSQYDVSWHIGTEMGFASGKPLKIQIDVMADWRGFGDRYKTQQRPAHFEVILIRSSRSFPMLDDRFHEIGIDETGSMELEGSWWIPRLRLAERGAV